MEIKTPDIEIKTPDEIQIKDWGQIKLQRRPSDRDTLSRRVVDGNSIVLFIKIGYFCRNCYGYDINEI